MNKLYFSYSTLAYCLQPENSHNWINRQMGIKSEETDSMRLGRKAHEIVQNHVGGLRADDRVKLDITFPFVETNNKEACKFVFPYGDYEILGFLDGDDPENKRFLELKFSGTPWSLSKFRDAVQRKIYALAKPEYTEAYLVTGSLYPEDWKKAPLKLYRQPLTKKDRDEALEFIAKGIAVFENGDFSGGLDENGRCTDPRCSWGNKCHFKHI